MPKKKTAKKVATRKTAASAKLPAKKIAEEVNSVTKQVEGFPRVSHKKALVARSGVTKDTGDKKSVPIVFSMDDVAALMASRKLQKTAETVEPTKPTTVVIEVKKTVTVIDQPVERRVHAAASLADILGFNPAQKKVNTDLDDADIPKKWKKYYKQLIELRKHVRDELDLHTSDTLKHSSREESGNQSGGYGNHQADAATDSFDRDFALSLVSSEQDALNEVEEAIQRIKNNSYGTCEVTGEPIAPERLEAVPFARFSVQGQAEYEKNKRRKFVRANGGIFDDGADAPKLQSDDDEE
ncbi:MAG: RNA polymerase-binding transcription factor DksA [Lentimonas sp.]|jgi:RNA polymerase-binding transcription factor DksA